MKKLANLIALFILVSVNIITPITYAEDEDPVAGEGARKYDCNLEYEEVEDTEDEGYRYNEGYRYFSCIEKDDGEYSCEEDDGYQCEYNGILKRCEDYGDGTIACYVDSYQKSEPQPDGGYNFTPSRDGEFSCSYGRVGGLGLSSNQRDASSYGDFVCSRNGGDGEEYYYGCEESGNGFFCPQLYNYYIDRDKGTYIFYKDTDNGYYSCDLDDFGEYGHPEDASIVEDYGDYVCGDSWWYVNSCNEDYVSLPSVQPQFLEDDYDLGYVCPISYSCYEEEGTYCYEEMGGEYKCKSNLSVGEKGLLDDMGEYSCSNGINIYSCEWNEDYWDYGRSGRFECEDPSDDGDDECLGEGAEYDEELGQCVYKVPGYDGKNIVIMSSNLGSTKNNLTGLYYQWGRNYGFPGYDGDTGGEETVDYQLSSEDMVIFEDYPTDEFSVWPTDTDPCPENFHVPSTSEWNNLLISWCENTAECDTRKLTRHELTNHWALNDVSEENGYAGNYGFEDEVYSFMDDLNFPLGGSLDGYNANMLGLMGDYWAKEFKKTDKNGNKSSWGFTVYPRGGLGPVPFISNHAASVRCFADVEDEVEVSTPVALDLYIGGCAQGDSIAPTSAIEVLEDSVLCENDGYRGRKFVASGEAVNLDELEDSFLPAGYNWVWYLDDDQTTKLTDNTSFTEDTELYAFEEELLDEYTITFDSNGGTPTPATQSIVYGSKATEPSNNPTKNGYTFGGWMLDGVEFNFSTPITGNITLTAKWDVLHYNIVYKDGETEIQGLTPSSYTVEDNVILPTLPTKTGYKFDGWSDNGTKITKIQAGNTGDKTLVAIWTEDKPSGGNSGGYSGGGSPSKPSSKGSGPSSTEVESKGDGPDTPAKEGTKTEPKPVVAGKADNYTGKVNPNQELFDAYEWAYANGLTKYSNMSDARMDDILNRQEMAKITTIFASKFKYNTPNEAKRDFCSQYPDLWKTTEDMQEYIIQSCELGYMGYRANGIDALDRFRPYTPVSVAELSIILSRIMWQNKYAINENLWYQGHLHAVYENNLLDNISKPFDYIIRKDAYIMLYRISKTL